jgi:hypothetical protein
MVAQSTTPEGLESIQTLARSIKEDDRKLFRLKISLKQSWLHTLLETIKSYGRNG